MRKTFAALFILLLSASFGLAQGAKKKEPRWESNLTLGYIDYSSYQEGNIDNMTRHLGIIKSFWYYPFLPRIVALGLSFDYVIDDLPISLNLALNLPTKFIVPFVCAGAGFSFSGNTIQGYGGGLKFRTGKRFGLIAEYRHHRIKKKSASYGMGGPTTYVIRETYYIGGGIAYLF